MCKPNTTPHAVRQWAGALLIAILGLSARGLAQKVATPEFSHPTGRYPNPLSLTLRCATPGSLPSVV